MSSERGNIKRTRPQKYKNKTAFQNNLHDNSKKTKDLNNLEIAEVCQQCKDVIEWKIKYKKYKPLSQPKTCIQCHQKSIKHAYHTLCDPCGKALKICCKCRQPKELIRRSIQMKPKEEVIAMMRKDLKLLPERKRRAFYRYLDSLYNTKTCKKKEKKMDKEDDDYEEDSSGEEDDGSNDPSEHQELEDAKKIEVTEDYLEKIRAKLQELGKGLLDDMPDSDADSEDEINESSR